MKDRVFICWVHLCYSVCHQHNTDSSIVHATIVDCDSK